MSGIPSVNHCQFDVRFADINVIVTETFINTSWDNESRRGKKQETRLMAEQGAIDIFREIGGVFFMDFSRKRPEHSLTIPA